MRKHPNRAYTNSEIFDAIRPTIRPHDFWSGLVFVASVLNVQEALEDLVRKGQVKAKVIKTKLAENTYYMATR